LTGTAKEYDLSVRALMNHFGIGLTDIEDWTCCGATAAQAVDSSIALTLSARNLALAGNTPCPGSCDILVPCSACYLNLKTAQADIETDKAVREMVNQVLAGENLTLSTRPNVRHLLDVLSRDLTWEPNMFSVSMEGLVVAPYYGCQCLRPFREFDDPEDPHSMDTMIRTTGAQVLDWDMGAQCCGASNATTKPESGRVLVDNILAAAGKAHCILTVCPMCQMNLETCGSRDKSIPILYLPQFLGQALGLDRKSLGLGLNLTDNKSLAGH